jgi:hypothetical protein
MTCGEQFSTALIARMAKPIILVCEERDQWIIAWRRALAATQDVVRPVRSVAQCASELAVAPASLVALEVTQGRAAALLSTIARWRHRFGGMRVIGMLSPSADDDGFDDGMEPLLYEAGATLVVRSALEIPAAARIARRHLSQAPLAPLPLREALLARLPWEQFATPAFAASGFARGERSSDGSAAPPAALPESPMGP